MSIGLVLAYFLVIPAYSSVTILSEQYHASGETLWGSPETGYSYTDSSPVSGSRIDEWDSVSSSAWMFGAMASTSASSGWAGASSTFFFTVDQPILIIQFSGNLNSTGFADIQGGVFYSLTENFNNNEIIGSRSWSLSDEDEVVGGWGQTIDESITFNLVPGMEYKLLLTANVTNVDGSFASLEAVIVPEPSSMMLVAFGGLLIVMRRARCSSCA